MKQMARNLTDGLDGFLSGYRYLIHDRASVFSADFRMILQAVGIESVRLPARSPNLNAFAERFVRSIKECCLHRMVLIGSPASIGRPRSSFCMITPNETIRAWGTKSSGPSSPNSPTRVPFTVASDSADCSATMT